MNLAFFLSFFLSKFIAPVILKFPLGKLPTVFREQEALRQEQNLLFHWQFFYFILFEHIGLHGHLQATNWEVFHILSLLYTTYTLTCELNATGEFGGGIAFRTPHTQHDTFLGGYRLTVVEIISSPIGTTSIRHSNPEFLIIHFVP